MKILAGISSFLAAIFAFFLFYGISLSDQIEIAVKNNLAAEQHGIKKTYGYQQQDANTENLYYRFGVTIDEGVFSCLHNLKISEGAGSL